MAQGVAHSEPGMWDIAAQQHRFEFTSQKKISRLPLRVFAALFRSAKSGALVFHAGKQWNQDGWQSGRLRTPGKRVYRKVTGVRIPPHPPL